MPLLQRLFGRVFIPPAVAAELAQPRGHYQPIDVGHYRFLEVVAPRELRQVLLNNAQLQAGEIEALSLALDLNADFVLMDEYAGRAAALKLGLQTSGVLGLLTRAKETGLI